MKSLKQALARIAELEERVESQQIMIDALVNQVRRAAGQSPRMLEEDDGRKSMDEMEGGVESEAQKAAFSRGVEHMFREKTSLEVFTGSMMIEGFVEFVKDSHQFSLSMRHDLKGKSGGLTSYVRANADRVVKNVIDNLNVYDLDTICSCLNMISGEMEYSHRLVVAHDIVIFIEDFSQLPFIFSALFNNLELREDVLSNTLKQILVHQCIIDREAYKNLPGMMECYSRIMKNLHIQPSQKSLELVCGNLIEDVAVFEDGEINPTIFQSMYGLRALCHYMDWDFTYNKMIQAVLYPRLESTRSPLCVVYIFVLTFNALRVFGRVESVDIVLARLRELMGDSSELSTVAYLFVKQLEPQEAERWLNSHGDEIESVSREYLQSLLLH